MLAAGRLPSPLRDELLNADLFTDVPLGPGRWRRRGSTSTTTGGRTLRWSTCPRPSSRDAERVRVMGRGMGSGRAVLPR
jgi:hypothetical protein